MKQILCSLTFQLKMFLILLAVSLVSCAKQPVPVPVAPKMPAPVEKQEIKPEPEKVHLVDIFLSEAEKFTNQGNYQEAFFIYNQALSQAGHDRFPEILKKAETVLSKLTPLEIKTYLDIDQIQIPKPVMLYWFGLNTSIEGDYAAAEQIFQSFLEQYPDHIYSDDVNNLLTLIRESLFRSDTIGCLLPLSGKYGKYGQRALSGIQLAIQELSQKYNKVFNLIIKDTKGDDKITLDAVRQLHEQRVAGIIGPLLNVAVAGQEAQRHRIPLIALTQKSDFSLNGDYLFANFITPEMQVKTLGSYLFAHLGLDKVAILYPNEKYGKAYKELFWDVVDEYGAQVAGVEAYDGSKTDFTEPIQKLTGEFFPVPDEIKEKQKQEAGLLEEDLEIDFAETDKDLLADENDEENKETEEEKIEIDFQALFIPDSPSRISLILPQLAFNDITGVYLAGTNLWHHKNLLKEARGYAKNTIITDGFFTESQNPLTIEFKKKYETVFNKLPRFLEAISYDTAVILYETAMDTQIKSRESLKQALLGDRIFEGVTGITVFDDQGRANRQLFLITLKKGKFVEISR